MAFFGCGKAKANSNTFCNEATDAITRLISVTKQINFENAFYQVGSGLTDDEAKQSTFPALWNYDYSSGGVDSSGCFHYTKASNTGAVPSGW
ncbi:MAG: hypothetical protein ACRCZY_06295 [Phocaeicola sp.]